MVIDTGVASELPEINHYLRHYDPLQIKDMNDHGTHITAIIATHGCKGLEIIPCKGAWDLKASNNCLKLALDLKVDIINYSMGGPYPEAEEEFLFRKLERAKIIVNAAAGNNGQGLFVKPYYPASYELNNINVIGALNENGEKASFSNYSSDVIWEPGVNIYSLDRFGITIPLSGTSQATANHTARMVKEWCNK
jgi:hypothetical protein